MDKRKLMVLELVNALYMCVCIFLRVEFVSTISAVLTVYDIYCFDGAETIFRIADEGRQ